MRFQIFPAPFLILTLFFTISNVTSVSGQCLQAQKDLLLELRNNLTYDSSLSTKLVQWDESIDCCKWSGVKCDNRGRVISLDLSKEPISGGINDPSSSLFKLEFLQNLSLAENSFGGIDLPTGFGNLKDLRYLNLSESGFSGQIPLDFSNLMRLVVLDLSAAYSSLQLQNPDLGRLIRNFTKLRELYLDGVNISAPGSVWCKAISSSLPELRVLSLSNAYLAGPFDSSLAKLKSLSVIHLDGNVFFSPLPEFFADFPNLRVLTMSASNLIRAPANIFKIKSLETIDLGNNRDLEGYLPEFPEDGALKHLVLDYTNFFGNVSESIGRLKMLSNFDLRACNFSGTIPTSIKNLTRLVYFDLSANNFVGPVPSFSFLRNLTTINLRGNGLTGKILDSHWEGLENLDFLDLSENHLEGEIPRSLFGLPSLVVLTLSHNSFSGSIRKTSISSSSPLGVIELDNNNLEGPIPRFFFEIQNISSISLSSNKFNGSFELTGSQILKDLASVDLSNNNLVVHVNENVSISSLFPRLESLFLASCKLDKFPLLRNQSSLMMLDLSINQIKGEIPNWLWEVGNGFLRFLNLSHNHFTHIQEPYDFRSLHFLDLHSNMLGGQIPLTPTPAVFIDFSSNNFSSFPIEVGNFLVRPISFSVSNNRIMGTIPLSFCNTSSIQILDLSNNSLHGAIPSCLLQQPAITVLNLGRNDLGGDIPDTFPVNSTLETLDLSWNALQGKVPRSLERCTNLKVLNLGNNELNDVFPCWLKNLPNLRVIVLRFNKFHGNISCLRDAKTWTQLQIIDVASNNLNGVLPENLFRNLNSMTVRQDNLDHLRFVLLPVNGIYYQDSVTVTLKGEDRDVVKILNIFTSMDFSNNHFSGTIPQTLGELKALYLLNFSRNALTGHIPSSIGNLKALGSLDLSLNDLGGEIPNQISGLTFLAFLNLSYNQLVGRIPGGSQMQTFSASSFIGNPGLCGYPLDKNCSHSTSSPLPEPESEEYHIFSDHGIYASAAIGFVVGLVFLFGPIVASERWRRRYNRNLNKFIMLVLRRQDYRLENEDW